MSDRRFRLAVLIAAVTGVGLRVIYVLTVVMGKVTPLGDTLVYHLAAKLLAGGEGYVRPIEFLVSGVRVPTAEFPPLWPMALAVLDLVGVDGPVEHRLAGALLGGVTIVVMAMIGEVLGGRLVGVVTALGVAVYPQWIVFDVSLLSEGLLLLLVATTLLGVLKAHNSKGVNASRWWLLASAALGLAAITRTESVLLVPLLIVPAAHHIDRRVWLRAAAVGSAGVFLSLGAWTARNAISLGHPQPFTNNSGTLIAGSNCETVYDGSRIGLWSFPCVPTIDFAHLDEVEGAALQRDAGISYAADHLSKLPKVAAVRVARTLGIWDVRTQLLFESFEGRDYNWLWAGWLMWIALVPLALTGGVSRRRHGDELWPLLVPMGIALFTAASSYGNQRFRVIAEPSVVLLAAIGLVAIARAISTAMVSRRGSPQRVQAPGGSL